MRPPPATDVGGSSAVGASGGGEGAAEAEAARNKGGRPSEKQLQMRKDALEKASLEAAELFATARKKPAIERDTQPSIITAMEKKHSLPPGSLQPDNIRRLSNKPDCERFVTRGAPCKLGLLHEMRIVRILLLLSAIMFAVYASQVGKRALGFLFASACVGAGGACRVSESVIGAFRIWPGTWEGGA